MDETFNDLKQTITETARVYGYISDIIGKNKNNKAVSDIVKTNPEQPFIFTGQITDLSYFQSNQTLPVSAIAEIGDEKLTQSVKCTFEDCAKNKLVSIDNESSTISLTKKGKSYISKESFVKQAKKDQLKAFKAKLESLKNQSKTASKIATGAKAGTSQIITKVSKVAAVATAATKVLKRD